MTDKDSSEIKKLHFQVKLLLEKKYTKEAIVEELQRQGLEAYYIETIIENIQDDESDIKSFRNSMIMGTFYTGAGLLINVLSYRFAEKSNSSFFILFWGIVVFGIITIIRGFIIYKR